MHQQSFPSKPVSRHLHNIESLLLANRFRVKPHPGQRVGVVVVGDLDDFLSHVASALPLVLVVTAVREQGDAIFDVGLRVRPQVAEDLSAALVGLVDEEVHDLEQGSVADERASDETARPRTVVVQFAETFVHRVGAGGVESVQLHDDALVMVAFLFFEFAEQVAVGVCGPLRERLGGGVLASGGRSEDGLGVEVGPGQRDEQLLRAEAVEFGRFGLAHRIGEVVGVHTVQTTRRAITFGRPVFAVESRSWRMDDALSARELYDRLQRGESLTLLDVRNRDEFDAWHIDAPRTVQKPYAEFMSARVNDEVADLADSLDLEEPVVAVCPRGDASDQVAEMLREIDIEALNLDDGMNGWAAVYVAREIERRVGEIETTIYQYERPSSGCLSYLVVSNGEAVVIDPLRAFADRYAEDASELGGELRYAIDTHVHADHVSGIREVADATDAEAVLPEGARDRGLAFDAQFVADGDEIAVGATALTAIHAPGHTSEMMLFRVGDVLFSADTLFLDGVGRPDLESGSDGAQELAGDLHETLHDRLLSLPDETTVAPGHVHAKTPRAEDGTYSERLATVRESIPLLSLDREEFVGQVADDLPPRPANYEDIVAVNLGRKSVEAETAFELELGPNNCAVQ